MGFVNLAKLVYSVWTQIAEKCNRILWQWQAL